MKKTQPSLPKTRLSRRTAEAVGAFDAMKGARLDAAAQLARAEALVAAIKKHGKIDACVAAAAKHARMLKRAVVDGDALTALAAGDERVFTALEAAAKAHDVMVEAKAARRVRLGARKAQAYGAAAVDAAQKHGAALPNPMLMEKRSWRVEVVDTPEGLIAKPAYVVRIEANAPIGRLSRAPRPGDEPALKAHHVAAASQVCALYFASQQSSKLCGSYDGVVVDGSGDGRARMIDVSCDSWRKLEAAFAGLLPVERQVIMEVAVYETPVERLARRGDLVHFNDKARAIGAIVQMLCCGLQRLSVFWKLDLGQPQNA
jgi:hypothetical protein